MTVETPVGCDPEIGQEVLAAGLFTNYHDVGTGAPVVLLHGSGPGVTAWANWRLTIPALARSMRVLAPDLVGFGYTQRPRNIEYRMDTWVEHALGFLDALELEKVCLVGNSFGGALALALSSRYPDRVEHLVLMGSAGVSFPITPALDEVWGYQPSVPEMRRLITTFVYDTAMATDELAELRYRASTRPGVQEAYESMFPAPRQRWVDALAIPEDAIAQLPHKTLIVHGREDQVLPLSSSMRLFELIPRAELHVFGNCGHWTQIEHADRFNGIVEQFLRSRRD
jgi:2-hydroxymuconate-semialdehyde hydrolase